MLFPDKEGTKTFAHEKETKAPEGATVGAGTGAVVGGALGWLVGIGSLAIPGVGPFIAAGPIVAALAGASVGGILLSVHCDDAEDIKKAKEVLKRTEATEISSSGEASVPKADMYETEKRVSNY